MLDGGERDTHILKLMENLITEGAKCPVFFLLKTHPHSAADISMIGTALIHQPLEQMANRSGDLRKSYTDLIMMLPRYRFPRM
jgi:hypothetical protein